MPNLTGIVYVYKFNGVDRESAERNASVIARSGQKSLLIYSKSLKNSSLKDLKKLDFGLQDGCSAPVAIN